MAHLPFSPKILVAPLDWGLGHATRCIPIIRELMAQGCSVLVAADGKVKALLQLEFPGLSFVELRGYQVEYASTGWGLAVKIVAQIPKILAAIKHEQEWLQKVIEEYRLDGVISDNRYGLYSEKIPSVFITHQLLIKAPVKLAEDVLQEMNYQYINKFAACWVPDVEGGNNLGGVLSHPPKLPEVPTTYIGILSRFAAKEEVKEQDYLLIILSGPEPQRTLLEEQLLEELKEYKEQVVLVRGLPQANETLAVQENVKVYHHLPAAELEELIREASLVISRCGYSTVMDLAALGKKSILIPTPGQTEQEYLARQLMQKNYVLCIEQKKFRLKHALELAASFSYKPFAMSSPNDLATAVSDWVAHLKEREQYP